MMIRIMPWQFGVLNLTEDDGFRTIKYTDQIFRGVREPSSPIVFILLTLRSIKLGFAQ